ncbi:MAG: ATP-dependent Clp protease ATP-binding subunit [Parcubacteria group bacterium]
MFNFDLKRAAIFQALVWEKILGIALIGKLRKTLLCLAFLTAFLFAWGFFGETFSLGTLKFLLGSSLISFGLFLAFWEINLFFTKKLVNPALKIRIEDAVLEDENCNLAEFLSFHSAKAVEKAKTSSLKLFYNLVCGNPSLNFVFSRALLDVAAIKKILKGKIREISQKEDSYIFSQVIKESLVAAQRRKHPRIEVGDMIVALSGCEPVFKDILINADLKTEDIENLVRWLESLEKKIIKNKRFWDWDNLMKNNSVGSSWAAGYTITLDQFSTDWKNIAGAFGQEDFLSSREQIEGMERILGQELVHNVLLIGEPGTGRKGMVLSLANRIISGKSLPELNYKRVVALDMVAVLSRCQSFDEVENALETIFGEAASAGNVILVIDEFYSFISQPSGKVGAVDISSILFRYLSLPNFRLIGITSYAGYHLFIEKNPSILKFMEKVEVPEATENETIAILENKVLNLEYKYKKFISYPALRDIVKYCNRYIKDAPFPKKAIDLLEEVVFYTVRYTKSKTILPEHVSKMVSKKTDIPVGELERKEKNILLNLEGLIHKRIINQEEAVSEVSSAMRRARADITVRKGPMGCFLFLGPTGVGKTETSKALAEVYFGSEEKMIRIDMSEFQSVADIPRLLGTSQEEGLLTTSVRENPFSLILLDEVEKAHPNILNLFLQVLDEGFLTDGLSRKVDFKNTIIIATSNAGYEVILEALKGNKEMQEIKNDLLDFLYKEKIFRPEFLNRFDALVVFKSLTKQHLLAIAELMLQKLKKNLKDKEIDFIITDALKEKIVELGFDRVFGARQMRRVIQDKLENVLAVALLSGEIKRGSKVEISPEDFKLTVKED